MKNKILRLLLKYLFIVKKMGEREFQILLYLKYRERISNGGPLPKFEEVGFNVFSNTYEDGILLYVFSLVGMKTKKCVDIGAGGVVNSNTANLIVNHGFEGLLIDGNKRNIQRLRNFYLRHPETCYLPPTCIASMVTQENVNSILSENGVTGEIDLLCIDIDGMDYWIWKAIDCIEPRVVVVEYQDILGPNRSWAVPYNPYFNNRDYEVNKEHTNYSGASLRAFVELGKEKGYRLVGCNKGGWNAFFVRSGIGEEYLPEVSVESCFAYPINKLGMEKRFPLVKDMNWQEV